MQPAVYPSPRLGSSGYPMFYPVSGHTPHSTVDSQRWTSRLLRCLTMSGWPSCLLNLPCLSPLQAAPTTELHHTIRLQQVRLGLVCACTAAAAAAAADVLLGLCLLSCCCCSLSCAEGGDVIGGHLLSWWTNSNESQVACEAVNAGTCPHVCTVLTSC
jgi:hypothetical protein